MSGQSTPRLAPRYGTRWIRAATDGLAGMHEMRAGITSPWRYARSLVGRNTFSVLNWRDPVPALGDLAILVGRVARPPRAKEAYA
jgi:hypothetical protein